MRALLVVLLVVGFLARYAVWIAAVLGAVVVFVAVLWLAFRLARRVDAKHAEHAVLVARADQQHAWILAGDDRGVYGQYPPYEN
jgi:ABC-type Fe3+-siderophore transport system permease subunit